jgi:hypothetical protein
LTFVPRKPKSIVPNFGVAAAGMSGDAVVAGFATCVGAGGTV